MSAMQGKANALHSELGSIPDGLHPVVYSQMTSTSPETMLETQNPRSKSELLCENPHVPYSPGYLDHVQVVTWLHCGIA